MRYIVVLLISLTTRGVAFASSPDLYMWYGSSPAPQVGDARQQVNLTLQNRGAMSITEQEIHIACYVLETDREILRKRIFIDILPSYGRIDTTVFLPYQALGYIAYCVVDSQDQLVETNESNNRTPNKYIIAKNPPLRPNPPSGPSPQPTPDPPLPPQPTPPSYPYPCGDKPCDFIPLPRIPLDPGHGNWRPPVVTPQPPCGRRGKRDGCRQRMPRRSPPSYPYPCGDKPCDFIPLPRIPLAPDADHCDGSTCKVIRPSSTNYRPGHWF